MSKATIGEALDAEYYGNSHNRSGQGGHSRSRTGNRSTGRSRNDNTTSATSATASQRSIDLATRLGFSRSGKATVLSGPRAGFVSAPDRQQRTVSSEEESESMRGLTEGVIMHTRDYAVEYEDHEMMPIQGAGGGREEGSEYAARRRS
jgi:hypothetical protein